MGAPTRHIELTAIGAALALLVVAAWLGQRSTAELVETAGWVDHSHRVIEELDGLMASVVDAETGRRGFALTDNEALLGPYHDAAHRAEQHLAELRKLTVDDAEQTRRLTAVEPRVMRRLRALEEAVAAQRATSFATFRGGPNTVAGNDEMEVVRAEIAEITRKERSLLAEREQNTRAGVASSRRVQLGSAALAIGLFGLAAMRHRREVRKREAFEEDSRRNAEDLAITLQSIGDGVIATDAEGLVTRMNPVAEAITGASFAEARGKPIEEVFHLVHESKAKEAPSPVRQALRNGKMVDIDDAAILVASDGTKRRVADSAAPIRSADGDVRGAVLVFRDITQTLEDARALRRTHSFLDSIVENIPNMIFVKDAQDLAFVRFNRAGEALLGVKREDLIGKTDFAFFPPDEAKAFVEKDRETLRGKKVLDIPEEPLTTATGLRWLHTMKVPIIDEDGEPEYLLGISEDITERRRADMRIRASNEATAVAHRELESFSYSVAHDLRAPLRAIDGFSQALLDDYADQLDEQGRSYLSRVRNSARRMAELIDDLLLLARVSRSELARSHVDVSAIARELGAELAREQYPKTELVVAPGLTANADPRLLRLLLENVLSNAFKFSSRREAPRVEVGQSLIDGHDVLFVKDNGAGFDVAAARKLFTAFQRYHRPTEFEGTGIGLATAERITSRHGGRIWAESSPDAGATFFFTFESGEKAT